MYPIIYNSNASIAEQKEEDRKTHSIEVPLDGQIDLSLKRLHRRLPLLVDRSLLWQGISEKEQNTLLNYHLRFGTTGKFRKLDSH